MCEQQLDLFSSAGIQADRPLPLSRKLRPAVTVLDDQALISGFLQGARTLAPASSVPKKHHSGARARRHPFQKSTTPVRARWVWRTSQAFAS
jgi:hypothetical protein